LGTYTATQDFYKPAPDEFVDVESQINYNLRRADEDVRAKVEWQYTELPVISGFAPRELGYKFYKASTNSLFVCAEADLTLQQHSPFCPTEAWTASGILSFPGGYQSEDLDTKRLSYSKEGFDGIVQWRGSLKLNNYDQIPLNTNIQVMTIDPAIAPARSKYFTVHMGIQAGNYSICRVLFLNTGSVEINRMGINQTDPTQRFVSFNDIQYPTNDT
jgi:hypothetical protein